MTSIRSFFCAALLATAVGCGGSTSAETVSPGTDQDSAAETQAEPGEPGGTSGRTVLEAPEEDTGNVPPEDSVTQSSEAERLGGETPSQPEAEVAAGEIESADAPQRSSAAASRVSSVEQPATIVEQPVTEFERRTVLDGAVSLDAPADFQVMSRAQREQRYAAGQRPSVVLTNSTSDVNIAFNLTPNEMQFGQLADFQRQMASLFRSQVAKDDWVGSSTTQIGGLDWFTIEMRTEAFGTKVWNLIAGTSLNGRLLLVSFNTTTEQEAAWSPLCRQMLQSVKLAAEPLQQPELSATK